MRGTLAPNVAFSKVACNLQPARPRQAASDYWQWSYLIVYCQLVEKLFCYYKKFIFFCGMDDMMYALNMLNQSVMNAANVSMAAGTKKQDRKFTRAMYFQQLADNRENWRMMNEYNSPSAQRERLRAAGLNDNLIYGSGGVVGTTQLPNGANYNAGYSQPPRFEITDNFGAYMQLRQFERQMELQEAQIKSMNADASLKNSQASYYNSQTAGQDIANWLAEQTKEYKLSEVHYKAWNAEFDSKLKSEYAFKQAEQTLQKTIAQVSLLKQQKNLTSKQAELIYYDKQVRLATIDELVARTGVDYAVAANYYDTIVSRAIHDDIDATKFVLNPHQGEFGGMQNMMDNFFAPFTDGRKPFSMIVSEAYDRMMNRVGDRTIIRDRSMPTVTRKQYRKYKRR